jgi:hypothetical protein
VLRRVQGPKAKPQGHPFRDPVRLQLYVSGDRQCGRQPGRELAEGRNTSVFFAPVGRVVLICGGYDCSEAAAAWHRHTL